MVQFSYFSEGGAQISARVILNAIWLTAIVNMFKLPGYYRSCCLSELIIVSKLKQDPRNYSVAMRREYGS